MFEDNENIIPTFPVLYVFAMDKVSDFMQAIQSIPSEEIGSYSVWNANQKESILYSSEGNEIANYKTVFCLQTDFKEEHEFLRLAAESQSLFYYPIYEEDKIFINMFFDKTIRTESYYNYVNSINKDANN